MCGICNKRFLSRSGLYKHTQKCFIKPQLENTLREPDINNLQNNGSLILELLKQNQAIILENQDFKALMVEQSKHMIELSKTNSVTNNNNSNNTNNQQFNLQFFLHLFTFQTPIL